MITAQVSFKVRDFDTWFKGSSEKSSDCDSTICTNCRVFTETDDRTQITFQADWESPEALNTFLNSEEHRDAMVRNGVIGEPEVKLLYEVQYSKV